MNQDHAAQIRGHVLDELELVHREFGSYPSTEYLSQRMTYDIATVELALVHLELRGTVIRDGMFAESHYAIVQSIHR
jgi:hypothetical protein